MSNDLKSAVVPIAQTSRRLKVLLFVSLAANLLMVGAAVGHRVWGDDRGRLAGEGYVQLVPRMFFADLPGQRRRELLDGLRHEMDGLRDLRSQSDASSLRIADALEKQPFDIAQVQQAVTDFATGSQSLAAKGADVVTHLVGKLTPEERAKLAAAIRDRDKRRKQYR